MNTCTKTLKVRVKDKHASVLRSMARDVNMVWNYCNEVSTRALRERGKFLSGFDLNNLTSGIVKIDGVSIVSSTVQEIGQEYAAKRKQFKKSRLNWRVSNHKSAKYSLGWIPFKTGSVAYKSGQIRYAGKFFSLWDSYGLGGFDLRAGCFSEDSRGRWYFNATIKYEAKNSEGTHAVGIDLGLKESAVCSTSQRIAGRQYRALEKKLGIAQRAGKKTQVRTIHAKIRNRRKDEQHKFSTMLVKQNAAIFVGDVSSKKLVKTKMVKSALDAGWGQLKTMLGNKANAAGIVFKVIDERYTTQTCSSCGALPDSRPRGIAGLGIREWTCCDCGASHDRDVNAAKNILALGLQSLAEGAAE